MPEPDAVDAIELLAGMQFDAWQRHVAEGLFASSDAAHGPTATWADIENAMRSAVDPPQWEYMAHPDEAWRVPAGAPVRLSEWAPRGQVIAFNRRELTVGPFTAPLFEPAPASAPSPDDTLSRIDETLTFYSAGLGEELTVTRPPDWSGDLGSTDRQTDAMLPVRVEMDGVDITRHVGGVWLDETHHFREASEIMSRAMSEFAGRMRSQVLPAFADFAARVRALRPFLAPPVRELLAEERRIRLRRRRMHHEYRRRRKGKW